MSLAQYAMQHPLLAPIYERVWRPTAFLTAMAFDVRHFRAEKAKAVEALRLEPGSTVLDIACGPGNFMEFYAKAVGEQGKAIGLDLSKPMLDRALVDNADAGQSYVLASGHRLPFADGSLDAVACYGALYLIPDPMKVVDEMIRVVRPGGRLAIMTSLASENATLQKVQARVAAPAGLSLFARDDLTFLLRGAGFSEIEWEAHGVLQYVAATAPA